jgi:hypothetical protein
MTSTITRSAGIAVGGYNPGGGRAGITVELDDVVAEAAERLRDRYGRDVEIRFNSDRQSGGAFVSAPASVGITAARVLLSRTRALVAGIEDFEDNCRRRGIDPAGPEEQTSMHVLVDAALLTDPGMANSGNDDARYAYVNVRDADAAMALLETSCTLS